MGIKFFHSFAWVLLFAFSILLGLSLQIVNTGPVIAASAQTNQQDQPFEFTELEPNSRLSETKITPGFPADVSIKQLLSKINLDERNLIWSGHWVYGDPLSGSVIIAIFDVDGDWHCYLDRNRDRVFQTEEILSPIDGKPGHWMTRLSAIQLDENGQPNESMEYPVQIRFDSKAASAFIATAGTMNGYVRFDGRWVVARYEDRNANGLWFDADDRLFVDFNGDGKINPITERLPGLGMRMIGDHLYAILGDPRGLTLSLKPVMEQSEVIPRIRTLSDNVEIVSLKASLGSTTGISIPITVLNQEVSLPTGQWRVKEVLLTIKQDDEVFEFNFLQRGRGNWIDIGADDIVDFELLGELKLSAVTNKISTANFEQILIMPMLTTESGCYLRGAHFGKNSASNENRLTSYSHFLGVNSMVLGSSGFS